MKKKILTTALGILLLACIPVAACGKTPAHTHTFKDGWEHNEEYHWHEASCEHTDEISGKDNHVAGEWQQVSQSTATEHGREEQACSVCGYVMNIRELPLKDPNRITSMGFAAHGETAALGVRGEELDDGSYKIIVPNPDDEDWHVKLEGHISFDTGAKYKLSITFTKSAESDVWIEASGGKSNAVHAAANVETVAEYVFTGTDSDYVCLLLGKGTEAFDVVVKDIRVEKLSDHDTNPITSMGLHAWAFSEGDANLGVTGEATEDGYYKVKATSPDGEAWHIKLEGNLNLEAGAQYKLTVTLVHSSEGKVKALVDGTADKVEAVEADVETDIVLNFTASDKKYFCVELGDRTEAFEVLFKQVKLEKLAEEDPNPITALGFKATGESSTLGVTGAATEEGYYRVSVAHPDDTDWHVKLETHYQFTAGKQYLVSFTLVKTEVEENVKIEASGTDSGFIWLVADTETTVNHVFTATDNDYVCLLLGKGTVPFEVLIKSAVIEEHEHAYAQTWSSDGENHWNACTCGAKDNEAAHTWTDATCTAPKTCSVCSETDGEALGHTGGTATCENKAVCTRCGEEYGELAAHTYGEWEVDDENEGYAKRVCSVCSHKDSHEIVEAANNPITSMGLGVWSFTENNTDLGVTAESTLVGYYKIKSTAPDNEAWHIKLEGNLDVEIGKEYKLTFTVVNTVGGNIKALASGQEKLQWLEDNVEATFSLTFTATGQYVCVEIGERSEAFEITFKSVVLERLSPATPCAITAMGLHAWSYTQDNTNLGVTGEETVEGYYKIKSTAPDNEAWHIKLEGDVAVTVGKTYTITFTVVNTVGGNIKALASGQEKLQWLEPNVEATFSLTFTATGQYVCVELGERSAAFEVTFKSVTIEEVTE